jgi:glycosyltransferase involved in cell wall biosynthesis
MLGSVERIKHPQKLGDHLDEVPTCDLSFVVLFEGWLADLERLHSSIVEHVQSSWELVVIDNPVDDEASERIATFDGVVHVPLRDSVGYGAGRNLGLRQSHGTVVCIVDTSVEIIGPLAIDIPADVGILGRWGVSGQDGFHYEEAEGPDVDAVEGYFMALRRSDLPTIGLFDPKFRFYRNADLDLSYQVRARTGLRTIVDATLPLERHEHRLWENTPDRDELSRKNFFRFRQHWFTGD